MKVYVITMNIVYDYEVLNDGVQLFTDKDKAWNEYRSLVDKYAKEANGMGWVLDGFNSCSREFEAYDDGYEAENHYRIRFDEQELDVSAAHSWELQTDVETKAIGEIREMLGKTGENTWSFGADATGRYNGDIPYVMAHHVMQDDTICEIGIYDISIDDDDDLIVGYHVANCYEVNGERYEGVLKDIVMPQYYQEIAHELWNGMKG